MAADIKDRALSQVTLSGVDIFPDHDGTRLVGGTCHFSLQGPNGEQQGPGANVFIAVPFQSSGTIQEAERAVLARALEVLARLASLSVDQLHQRLVQLRGEDAAANMPNFHKDKN